MLQVSIIGAEQRRKDARICVRSDGVARAQEKAPAVNPDFPILLHVGCKVPYDPDLASGCDTLDSSIRRTCRYYADPAAE